MTLLGLETLSSDELDAHTFHQQSADSIQHQSGQMQVVKSKLFGPNFYSCIKNIYCCESAMGCNVILRVQRNVLRSKTSTWQPCLS
jgi:hypothetical protein